MEDCTQTRQQKHSCRMAELIGRAVCTLFAMASVRKNYKTNRFIYDWMRNTLENRRNSFLGSLKIHLKSCYRSLLRFYFKGEELGCWSYYMSRTMNLAVYGLVNMPERDNSSLLASW